MMNNPGLDQQMQPFRQMAQEKGIAGSVYIDIDPASGFFRVKLKVTPLQERANLTSGLGMVVEMMANGLGLQVNKAEKNSGEVNNG
jgi:hypothetical protein